MQNNIQFGYHNINVQVFCHKDIIKYSFTFKNNNVGFENDSLQILMFKAEADSIQFIGVRYAK